MKGVSRHTAISLPLTLMLMVFVAYQLESPIVQSSRIPGPVAHRKIVSPCDVESKESGGSKCRTDGHRTESQSVLAIGPVLLQTRQFIPSRKLPKILLSCLLLTQTSSSAI